ncbi:unnamed protein product [Parnassius apollo]|uniref:(apollo) hypothetical protein n=1 Tax=Parnassius apollo TaxID=110799 RepID=A0A8S3WAB8_PARAO|nr:unnamed protein product [Parnassius apollo]
MGQLDRLQDTGDKRGHSPPDGFPVICVAPIAPEDLSTGLAVVYGFTPRLVTGNDHRVGFGFRFGNHADFQILYEFGPQTITKPLQPAKTRSTTYRKHVRKTRRRPIIELLLRAGLLREVERVENLDI